MNKIDISKVFFIAGNLLILGGALMRLFNVEYAPYVFSLGVAVLIYLQVKFAIENRDAEARQRRLSRNGLFSTLLLGVGAYFMFTSSRETWVIAILIYALSTLIVSFRENKK